MFLLKKGINCFGFKLLRCFVIVNLAFEKVLSAEVDVAGIFSNEWAISARTVKNMEFFFHLVRGLVV